MLLQEEFRTRRARTSAARTRTRVPRAPWERPTRSDLASAKAAAADLEGRRSTSPFRMILRARGGSGIFAWVLVGGKLPTGLRLGADGSIMGTPRISGTYQFEAKATDTESRSLRWAATLSVAPRLLIRTQRLPAATVGRFYSADLTAVGGATPKVWKLTRGRLPRGIRLVSALGRFTGTPKESGRHLVTVEVSDGLKVKYTKVFSIVVVDPRARGR